MVENAFGILASRFRVLLTTMEQSPKVVRDIVLTCIVLHNMLRSHQGGEERPPTDDIQPPQNDQGEQGLDENVRIHQGRQNDNETYSKTISTNLGHWLGSRTEFKKTVWRRRSCHHKTINPFKDYSNLSKTIIQQVFIKILISQCV